MASKTIYHFVSNFIQSFWSGALMLVPSGMHSGPSTAIYIYIYTNIYRYFSMLIPIHVVSLVSLLAACLWIYLPSVLV